MRPTVHGIVFAQDTTGHRGSYLATLSDAFGLSIESGRIGIERFVRLVTSDRLLFATLDDDPPAFVTIALLRCLLRKRTAALFIRPQTCFNSGKLKYFAKRKLYQALRRVPGLTIATIIPFSFDLRYGSIATVGLADPQFWDLYKHGASISLRKSKLADEIVKVAAGRSICIQIGRQDPDKGLEFLAQTLLRFPSIADSTLVVCAGEISPSGRNASAAIADCGGLTVDRFLTDAEIESLYSIAKYVWACYKPDRDQASGVFGRALQLGVAAIVRSGSLAHAVAVSTPAPHVAVAYDDHAAVARALSYPVNTSPDADTLKRLTTIERWREDFNATLSHALRLSERKDKPAA